QPGSPACLRFPAGACRSPLRRAVATDAWHCCHSARVPARSCPGGSCRTEKLPAGLSACCTYGSGSCAGLRSRYEVIDEILRIEPFTRQFTQGLVPVQQAAPAEQAVTQPLAGTGLAYQGLASEPVL